jgi:acyl carrier protein
VNEARIRARLFEVLREIAPEVAPHDVDPRADLREQVDLDSFDLLQLMLRIQAAFGVEIPERDYTRLRTLEDAVGYLAAHVGPGR